MFFMVSGHYNPTAGSNVYYACPPGSYRASSGSIGSSSCTLSTSGSYMPFSGSSVSVASFPCATSLLPGASLCNSGRLGLLGREEVGPA